MEILHVAVDGRERGHQQRMPGPYEHQPAILCECRCVGARVDVHLAAVHRDATATASGDRRLVYGGHTVALAQASLERTLGGLATVGTQDTWLDGYGIIAYGVTPLLFIPLAAGFTFLGLLGLVITEWAERRRT